MSAGPRAAMTCLLFKYLYFFLCDERLLPEKTLLKVGPDVVSRSHGLFPAWVRHFNSSLPGILRAPVRRYYPRVCQPCLQAVGLGAGLPCAGGPPSHASHRLSRSGRVLSTCWMEVNPFPLFSCWTESNLASLLAWDNRTCWSLLSLPKVLKPLSCPVAVRMHTREARTPRACRYCNQCLPSL